MNGGLKPTLFSLVSPQARCGRYLVDLVLKRAAFAGDDREGDCYLRPCVMLRSFSAVSRQWSFL